MPRVLIDSSVAPDFKELINETWWKFLVFFEARTDCFGDVRVVAVKELSDRARYIPETATVLVRIPERGSLLRNALIHEWAHHIEFQCAAQIEMRSSFLAAQGFAPNTPWRAEKGSVELPTYLWAKIPSEQFAEMVTAVVLNNQDMRTPVPMSDRGIQIVRAWARKQPLPKLNS